LNLRSTLLSLCLFGLGCASTQGTAAATAVREAPVPADARRELLAALEREQEPLPVRPLEAPQGRFTARVEAAGDPVFEDDQDFTVVDLPIGTETAIKCFIYRDSIDVGQSLQAMIGELSSSLRVEALRPVEIVAAGDRPAVFLELDYTTEAPGGQRAAGQVKILAAPHDDLPLVCFHDELGFRRTFRRITQALAASLEPFGKTPRFNELQVFKINGLPVGFEQRRVWEVEQDQTIVETATVLMMPRSRTELTFQDNVSTAVSDAAGRLSQYVFAKAVNGELVLQATLERQRGNTYSVQGTQGGKEFSATLTSKDKAGLASELLIQREVKDALLGGQKAELSFETYRPATQVTALQTVHYRRIADRARGVSVQLEDVTMEGEVDEHGAMERMDLPLGQGARMVMDRVLAQGTP